MDRASDAPGDRRNALQRASTGAPDRSLEDRVRRLERESRNLKRMALLLPDRTEERSMHCRVCRHENSPESRYCLECGEVLSGVCRDCGTKLPNTAKYCNRCGTSTAARAKELPDALTSAATESEALAPEHDAADEGESSSAREAEALATQPLAPLASEAEAPATAPPAYEQLLRSLLSYFKLPRTIGGSVVWFLLVPMPLCLITTGVLALLEIPVGLSDLLPAFAAGSGALLLIKGRPPARQP
jgi:ribosomal protein L40E